MYGRLFTLCLLFACQPSDEWEPMSRPADYQAPPGSGGLTLTGPAFAFDGVPATFEVRASDLYFADIVELGWGGAQVAGPCPRYAMTQLCLDIGAPAKRVGGDFARRDPLDPSGYVATFQLTPNPAVGSVAYLQALRTAAARSATSNVLEVQVLPCTYLGETDECPADSCKQILDENQSQGDGTYWVDLGSGALEVECDMTQDGGGWTKVVNILTTSLHHGDNPNAAGTMGNPAVEGKLSDADITALTVGGFWRWQCGTSENSFVRTLSGNWTSMRTNAESWELDAARDGTFECTANRAGYVFSDHTDPACSPTHTDYVSSMGAPEGTGCYTIEQGWGLAGSLWAR